MISNASCFLEMPIVQNVRWAGLKIYFLPLSELATLQQQIYTYATLHRSLNQLLMHEHVMTLLLSRWARLAARS